MFVGSLIAGSLLCAWAMLRLMGNERSRGQRNIAARVRSEQAVGAAAAEPPPEVVHTVGSPVESPRKAA